MRAFIAFIAGIVFTVPWVVIVVKILDIAARHMEVRELHVYLVGFSGPAVAVVCALLLARWGKSSYQTVAAFATGFLAGILVVLSLLEGMGPR